MKLSRRLKYLKAVKQKRQLLSIQLSDASNTEQVQIRTLQAGAPAGQCKSDFPKDKQHRTPRKSRVTTSATTTNDVEPVSGPHAVRSVFTRGLLNCIRPIYVAANIRKSINAQWVDESSDLQSACCHRK